MGIDDTLIKNAQKTIDRLIRQLAEIDNEKSSLDEEEYRDLRESTVNQLEEFGKIVERLQGGDVSLIDELTATKIAIRAAISKAFKTPEVMALFAGKKNGLLREKLMMTETNYRSQKISKQEYHERKFEILMALQRLDEKLTGDESKYLRDRLETPEFQLIEANANRVFGGTISSDP
uniref:Protein LZIC n=1 Tax=Caenorhabditis tropicalis TaxID=1561998 RepID=A0A1I7UUB7_9PELO